jgi:hypothetical protein
MRVFLFALLIALISVPVGTAGLIDHWTFDQNLLDPVGSHDGVATGSVPYVTGRFGDAIDLTAVNGTNWVEFGDASVFQFGPSDVFSITFWMNTTSTADDQLVVGKHHSTIPASYVIGMNQSAGGVYGQPGKVWFYTGIPGNTPMPTSTLDVTDGVWHLVAAVKSSSNITIYVDGVQGTTTGWGNLDPNDAPFRAGGMTAAGGGVDTYSGYLDDLRIYDNALTGQDVLALYNNSVPEPSTWVAAAGLAGLLLVSRRIRTR